MQNPHFFQEIQNHMNKISDDHVVLVGDFNGTVDNNLDRSNKISKKRKIQKSGKLLNTFFKLVENENLVDIWRGKKQKS